MKLAAGLALLLIVLLCVSTWLGRNPAWTTICTVSVVVLMVLTRCMSINEVRNSIDLQLLLTIVAALGLGRALTASSGRPEYITAFLVERVRARTPYCY